MSIELPRDARRWAMRAPDIANLVLVALIALAVARLFWLVWPEPARRVVAPNNAGSNSRAVARPPIDIESIAGAHMFGEKTTNNTAADQKKQIKAPETHLKLELTGIVSDSRGARSRALIKDPKGKQDSYKVGQPIISGAKLHAIYADRVILDRSGHYETLTLESIKQARSMRKILNRSRISAASASSPTDSSSGNVQ